MSTDNPSQQKPIVTAIMATSINGLLTNGTNPNPEIWTSLEDKKFFRKMLDEAEVIVMGSATFEAQNPSQEPKRQDKFTVILSSDPEKYTDYQKTGVREFWNKSASDTLAELRDRDFKQLLLLGGGLIFAEFFKSNLVDDFWLTVEPKLFGSGRPMIDSRNDFEQDFRLDLTNQLNSQGSLLLHYTRA